MKRIALQEFIDAIGTDRVVVCGIEGEYDYFEGKVVSWKPPNNDTRTSYRGDFLVCVTGQATSYVGVAHSAYREVPSKMLRWKDEGVGSQLRRGARRMRI